MNAYSHQMKHIKVFISKIYVFPSIETRTEFFFFFFISFIHLLIYDHSILCIWVRGKAPIWVKKIKRQWSGPVLTNSTSCPKHQTGKEHVQLRRHKTKTAILDRQEDNSVDPHFSYFIFVTFMWRIRTNKSHFFKCDIYVWRIWDFNICRYEFFSQMSDWHEIQTDLCEFVKWHKTWTHLSHGW